MTAGLGLLGVKFSDLQPDISNTAQDRRLLTSMFMLPSPSDLGVGLMGTGYNDGGDLTKRHYLLVLVLHWEGQNIDFQVNRLACSKTYAAGQQLWQGGYNRIIAPIQTYGVNDLGAQQQGVGRLPVG